MKLPVADGKEYEVPDDLVSAYCAVRPDALEQFARMRIWLETHRSRRPKRADLFIAAWFRRSRGPAPVSAAAHNKNIVMGAIFGNSNRREVIDVEPTVIARRVG